MRRKIGFDARMIEHSGIGVRIQHILKLWPISKNTYELFVFGDEMILSKYELPKDSKIIHYTPKIYSIREWFGHPLMKDMDFLDIPHFNIPIRYLRKCIVTIHDLIPYHFKSAHSSLVKRVYLNIVLRLISWFALKVVTVSEYTRMDFHVQFGRKINTIDVIHNGIEPNNFSKSPSSKINAFKKKYHLPSEFLLFVGIGKPHKNFGFLAHNLTDLWLKGELEIPLVIAGMSKEIPAEINELIRRFPNQIQILKHIPYNELPLLYQAAKLFIFPSLFEGFGFPVLEAQAVGTPVLSSNATVLPEILGQSALLFDPLDNEDFQTKLLLLLRNPQERSRISKLGIQNTLRFDWNDQMSGIKLLYQKLY
ncbi:MAG: glycosyltransferase family 1 protein [Leptospira sp.]|nr:glycosyltransferase family 1 protein [Leptospira sp.]